MYKKLLLGKIGLVEKEDYWAAGVNKTKRCANRADVDSQGG